MDDGGGRWRSAHVKWRVCPVMAREMTSPETYRRVYNAGLEIVDPTECNCDGSLPPYKCEEASALMAWAEVKFMRYSRRSWITP
jgi:hypothetical protein